MILICVGASEFGFDRLLQIIDELCNEGVIEKKHVLAQTGSSKYIPQNFEFFDLLSREEFQKYMNDAELIITHAGTGSVIPPLKLGKKVIVFPRRAKYHEHIDDHQLELANCFSKMGCVLCANNKEELDKCLQEYQNFKPMPFKSNNQDMNRLIIDFIEETVNARHS